ncbi:MAG: NAD-dependent epimerase/dehydratase family protein [Gammaproteobacteria bacterium]|nr:NAD-dependent epimerase/dehydratase family protein [Gammaproteobacteria bacterium]
MKYLSASIAALLFLAGAATAHEDDAAMTGRIVVIGATARSSLEIIPQALDRGYEVVAMARVPADLSLSHERLRIVAGDVYDVASLEAVLTGSEVVISMVGPRLDPLKEVGQIDLFTRGTGNIIAAMKKKGNRRLLVASSIGVETEFPAAKPDAVKEPGQMWVWNTRYLYKDMREMEDIVRTSGLDWVILRPGFMVEEPMRNDLKLSVNENSPKQRILTYADFGRFVVDQVAGNDHLGQTVGLWTDRLLQFGQNVDFEKESQMMREKAALEESRKSAAGK